MDGRQWTGRELARVANITPSTASTHLHRLVDGAIINAVAHGRHKYYCISRPDIARALETLMTLAPISVPKHARVIDSTLRRLRTCYDHLAGQLAVELCDTLIARGAIGFSDTAGRMTPDGTEVFSRLGIPLDATPSRRLMCRPCLDWSERRYHLAGRVGAVLLRHAVDNGWVVHQQDTRALAVTERGIVAFREAFDVDCTDVYGG